MDKDTPCAWHHPGLGFRVQGSRFMVYGSWFGVSGSGFREMKGPVLSNSVTRILALRRFAVALGFRIAVVVKISGPALRIKWPLTFQATQLKCFAFKPLMRTCFARKAAAPQRRANGTP